MFKRKHYRFLLDWACQDNLASSTMERLADRLQADNPLFDRDQFLQPFYKVKNERRARERVAARVALVVDNKKPEPRIRPNESFQEYADRIKLERNLP